MCLSLPDLGVWEVELSAGSLGPSVSSLGPPHPAPPLTHLSVSCLVLQLPQPVRGWAAVPALRGLGWLSAQRQSLRQEPAQLHPLLAEVSPGDGRAGEGRTPCMCARPRPGSCWECTAWLTLAAAWIRSHKGHGVGTEKPRRDEDGTLSKRPGGPLQHGLVFLGRSPH